VWEWDLARDTATVMGLRCAITDITGTRPTRARHTATTGLAGFLAVYSLALAPGSVGRASLVEVSVEALDLDSAGGVADAALADEALLVAGSPGAGDSPAVGPAASTEAVDFMVAAAVDSTVVAAVMVADTGNRRVIEVV
jgi:hypothetical protein